MSTRLRTLRQEVVDDQIHRLVKGEEHAYLRKKPRLYLLGKLPATAAA